MRWVFHDGEYNLELSPPAANVGRKPTILRQAGVGGVVLVPGDGGIVALSPDAAWELAGIAERWVHKMIWGPEPGEEPKPKTYTAEEEAELLRRYRKLCVRVRNTMEQPMRLTGYDEKGTAQLEPLVILKPFICSKCRCQTAGRCHEPNCPNPGTTP